jgi:biotin carboxyl carrier protein
MIEILAPMAGTVFELKVQPGDSVVEGQDMLILEAMKMEMPIIASETAKVKEVKCCKGDAVTFDQVLIVLEV